MSDPAVSRDAAALAPYLEDASGMDGGHAELLLRPRDHEEAAAMLRDLAEHRIPVTVSGSGTGVTGGRVPQGGAVLATDGLRRIGEPQADLSVGGARIRIGAGVLLSELAEALEPAGWIYPLDPTEATASAGGTVATNASGPWGFRTGSTRRLVTALSGVLVDGRSFRVARREYPDAPSDLSLTLDGGGHVEIPVRDWRRIATRKSSAGYVPEGDIVDLLVGSEGTLAVVTEVELRLEPRPAERLAALFLFDDEGSALRFVARVAHGEDLAEARPWSVEFLDGASLRLARARDPALPSAGAAVSLDRGLRDPAEEGLVLETWSAAADRTGGVRDALAATARPDLDRYRALRHAVPEGLNAQFARLGTLKISTDTAVPRRELPAWVDAVRRLANAAGVEAVVFGHAGDANLHVNLVPGHADEVGRATAVRDAIVKRAVELGGTCSAEHGIGKTRRSCLESMFPKQELASMRAVRRAFDPDERLGRGTLFGTERAP